MTDVNYWCCLFFMSFNTLLPESNIVLVINTIKSLHRVNIILTEIKCYLQITISECEL